jgi:hypothetical protein
MDHLKNVLKPMTKQTKIFLALLILVIGGGLVYWQFQEGNKPVIEVTGINRTTSLIKVSFKMSYKGIQYTDSIQHPAIWKRSQKGYRFEAISKGDSIYFYIKDKDGATIANKVSLIAN